ncbi:DUF4838 domain-containing protein [Silvibacterium sp.]|uniref:DUF4838 domain-containing protein n=1 Tax=Silvibacterium sp. TaxID=1964179 RepID=UPI0039E375AE
MDFQKKISRQKLTRRNFLQSSSLFAAGSMFLPSSALAAMSDIREVSLDALSQYTIVIPDQPDAIEQQAAAQLQNYLQKELGQSLAITREGAYRKGPAFFLGRTRQAQHLPLDPLQRDGFAYHPVPHGLIILGGTNKGVLYGVYGLLELWQFRMYTSAAIDVPRAKSIALPKAPVVVVPPVHYRTTSYRDTLDPEYMAWHRLSSHDDWGLFVHTFNELMPPEQYGTSHPEYYSLINGRRVPGAQLCLSNREVLAELIANLRKKIADKPEATYWSVSQNDNNQYCRCEPCTQLNTKYGGVPSGSILYFVNDVAKAFPDKTISTLAYWYSRTPPANIEAEPNVNIMLCNIESRRQGPVYETDPAFAKELVTWGRLAKSILIWDYTIQFTNLVSPFPNLHTLKPNIQFYLDNHVNSLFMQANREVGGEMAGLRAYMLAKLMWDPGADDSVIMDEYLNGYYGAAGRPIRAYIDRMRESLVQSGLKLNIFGSPEDAKDSYLSQERMQVYNQLFDQAEKAVAADAQLSARVRAARLPLLYATIQIGRNEVDTPRSLYAHAPDGKVFVKPEMKPLVSQFVDGCKQEGVSRLRERSTSPEDYLASYERAFAGIAEAQYAASFRKKITPVTLPDGGAAAAQRLTDGLFGSWESWSAPDVNWIAYKGEHMDFVLDLGEVREVRSIRMDFLNVQAQPDFNLLVLPAYVTYAISVDDHTYGDAVKIANPNNPDPKQNPEITKVPVQPFRLDFSTGQRARYIRVHAESILRMPAWHLRAGEPAEIYTDQIVVL